MFALGLVVYWAQVHLSNVWLCHYRFGPIEWCWRTLTYGQLQAMRRQGHDPEGPAFMQPVHLAKRKCRYQITNPSSSQGG